MASRPSGSLSRRDVLRGAAVGSLALASDLGSGLSRDDVRCRGERVEYPSQVTDRRDPERIWRLGEPVEDPVVPYRPWAVAVANAGVHRRVSVTIRRRDAAAPALARDLVLGDREWAVVLLREPDRWAAEVETSGGAAVRRTIDAFDCNSQTFAVLVRCDGSLNTTHSTSLVNCPGVYPLDEAE